MGGATTLAEYGRVRRAGDTMLGDLDFDVNKAKFGTGREIFFDGSALRIESDSLIALQIGADDPVQVGASTISFAGMLGDVDMIFDANDRLRFVKASDRWEFEVGAGADKALQLSNAVLTINESGGFSSLNFGASFAMAANVLSDAFEMLVSGSTAFLYENDPTTGGNIQMFDSAGFPAGDVCRVGNDGAGGMFLKVKSGEKFQFAIEGGSNFTELSDGLLDLSLMTTPSEIKMNLFSQAAEPVLDADGKFAFWEDTNDGLKLRLIARNNSITKSVVLNGAAAGYKQNYGADMSTAGKFLQANGEGNAVERVPLDPVSEVSVPIAGTLKTLSWNTDSADATTIIKVIKNGSVVETITLTGASGFDSTLTTAISVGDKLALEYDAGTSPATSNMCISIEG